jgi:hypothetical protein
MSKLLHVDKDVLKSDSGPKSYKSVNIPQRDDPNYPHVTKRCDACRPLGIFRCGEEEFLLCYDGAYPSDIICMKISSMSIFFRNGPFC